MCKKTNPLLVLCGFILFCQLTTGCASMDSGDGDMGLDVAIQNSAKNIVRNLAEGSKVAVLNFSASPGSLSEYVLEELSIALMTEQKLLVVDRRNLDIIRDEMQFQLSGDVDDESAQSIGKMLGAQFVITGSFAEVGTYYRFRVNAINVETAVKSASVSLRVSKKDKQVTFFIEGVKNPPGSESQNNVVVSKPAASNDPLEGIWEGTTKEGESIVVVFINNMMARLKEDGFDGGIFYTYLGGNIVGKEERWNYNLSNNNLKLSHQEYQDEVYNLRRVDDKSSINTPFEGTWEGRSDGSNEWKYTFIFYKDMCIMVDDNYIEEANRINFTNKKIYFMNLDGENEMIFDYTLNKNKLILDNEDEDIRIELVKR
jgi:TolB-like protein